MYSNILIVVSTNKKDSIHERSSISWKDENIAMRQSSFEDKVWTGLVELLCNPEEIKAQSDKRLERKNRVISLWLPILAKLLKNWKSYPYQSREFLTHTGKGLLVSMI